MPTALSPYGWSVCRFNLGMESVGCWGRAWGAGDERGLLGTSVGCWGQALSLSATPPDQVHLQEEGACSPGPASLRTTLGISVPLPPTTPFSVRSSWHNQRKQTLLMALNLEGSLFKYLPLHN